LTKNNRATVLSSSLLKVWTR